MLRKPLAFLSLLAVLIIPSLARAVEGFEFLPIAHASVAVKIDGVGMVYIDPVGDSPVYEKAGDAAVILVTHIHGDHMDKKRLSALKKDNTVILAPKSVVDQLGYGEAIATGTSKKLGALTVEAIAAYNVTEGRLDYHPKARGDNGYVLEMGGKRVYFSGDTEGVSEMLALKGIDHAFVCMNLPYTMDEEAAAKAVLTFRPKAVTPYHYRSKDAGVSKLEVFKKLVGGEGDIKIVEMALY